MQVAIARLARHLQVQALNDGVDRDVLAAPALQADDVAVHWTHRLAVVVEDVTEARAVLAVVVWLLYAVHMAVGVASLTQGNAARIAVDGVTNAVLVERQRDVDLAQELQHHVLRQPIDRGLAR